MPNTQQIDAAISKHQEASAKHQEEIKKLEALKQMASDPEMLILMKAIVTANGIAPAHLPVAPTVVVQPGHLAGSKNQIKKGDLRNAVIKAISSIDLFSAPRVVEIMKDGGFAFASGTPNIAVNSVLRKLVAQGRLRIATEGSGRTPHTYQHVKKGI